MDFKNREYRFYSDNVEYFDGWLTINRHTIPIKKITDITTRETLWNRFFQTASIRLLTAGTFASVEMPHVKNPEKVYNYLKEEILKL